MPNTVNFLMRKPLVIGSNDVHHNRACPERRTLRTLSRHGLYSACNHHLQSAARAARGNIDVYPDIPTGWRNNLFSIQNLSSREFFDLSESI
jgi:hypothetical protein